MAEFVWRAVGPSGKLSQGRIEAASAEQAAVRLQSQGLVPLQVEAASAAAAAQDAPAAAAKPRAPRPGLLARWRDNRPVSRPEVLGLTHELSIMLRAGLSLAYALRVLIDMNPRPPVRALLQQVLDDVKDGAPLSRAVTRHGPLFGEFYVSMVRAGEASGQLANVMERLAAHLGRLAQMRENVISAATYPLILLVVSVLSLAGMIGFVVPQFEKLFTDMGDAVPLPTRMVLGISHFAREWGYVAGIVLVTALWLFGRWAAKPAGRLKVQRWLLQLPLVGSLVMNFQLVVFARTLGTLVGSGVPLLGALDIAVSTVGSQPVRQALGGLLAPVKSGGRLAQAMADTGQFEPLAINLVRVGEETGRLGPMLLEFSELTDRRVETGIKRLLTLLEPALIIVLGAMIATMIISILLGILSINDLAV